MHFPFIHSRNFLFLISYFYKVFSKELLAKLKQLDQQKRKTVEAFHSYLPAPIVRDIQSDRVSFFYIKFLAELLKDKLCQGTKFWIENVQKLAYIIYVFIQISRLELLLSYVKIKNCHLQG